MKKILTFFLAGAVITALGGACGDSDGGGEETRQPEETRGEQPQDANSKPEPELEPNTYVTEYYRIVNQMDSDIVVELKSGDEEVITIKPGEEREIKKLDIVYEPGIAYSRSMYTVDRAVITIIGEIMPEFIWLFEYWHKARDDGEDDYHYSLTYTLTVTDELVESIVQRHAAIMHVITDYKIINQTESDVVIELRSGIVITIKPGDMQAIHEWESDMEPYLIENGSFLPVPANPDGMKIDGEAVPYIWQSKYWNRKLEFGDSNSCYRTYTLIVTDELVTSLREEYNYKRQLM